MTIEQLKEEGLILFESIAGSRAYGTDLPHSDIDIRGVFVLPKTQFYSLNYIAQVNDERNDISYYELSKFVELLLKNNPSALELLGMPEECIQIKHPLFDAFKQELFLSRICKDSFAGYATTQVKKARGLNKKIDNPMPKERKGILDFCYVLKGYGSISLLEWLIENKLEQERCGLVAIDHMRETFAVFYDGENNLGYKGIVQKEHSNKVSLSNIPKGEKERAIMQFNKDGYSAFCKDYKSYWDWVEKRNEDRYTNNIEHGKNYDSKNMMHTHRLLDVAAEIAEKKKIIVRRSNREELLEIRKGKFEYEDLLAKAETKIKHIETLYANSDLPQKPDAAQINQLLIDTRMKWYEQA